MNSTGAKQHVASRLHGPWWFLAAIGPGIVVAGSVMGSGELINTPVQAARFGFVLLWAVLLSCVIKYFLQVEIGRHCLVHGRTTFQALNLCPGPRWRNTSWVGLMYMAGYTVTMSVTVGIIGALAGMMHRIWPLATSEDTSLQLWSVAVVVLAAALLWRGLYRHLELLVSILVGLFSISVAIGVVLIQGTEYRITADDVSNGLACSLGAPDLRRDAAYAVISLMGALGTTANELFMYPYWILEKGYARQLGNPQDAGWSGRARRWIRVLFVDAGVATMLATAMTAAFFLLGAAVLHKRAIVPQGNHVVDIISQVYTESYGPWSRYVFQIGAFCTLFSTLVVIAAASGRMWSDMLSSLGWLDRHNEPATRRCHRIVQILWLGGLLSAYLVLKREPVGLVVFGHFFVGAFCGPLLMLAICWLAFRTDRRVRMRWPMAVLLLTTTAVIIACVVGGITIRYASPADDPEVNETAVEETALEIQPNFGGTMPIKICRSSCADPLGGQPLNRSAT